MADAPQLAYDQTIPIAYTPQDEHIDSKEKAYYHDSAANNTLYTQDEQPHPSHKTVLGIRRRNFWILFIGIATIVAATIGGSVGGALAVRNKNNTQDTSSQPITSGSPSLSPSATTATNPSATISTNASSTSIDMAPNPRNVASINVTCPFSLKDFTNKEYDCTNDITLEGGEPDVTGMIAYNLQQCIDACSTYNELTKNATCVAVVLVSTMADAYATNHGANCWLKRSGNGEKGRVGNTAARRKA